MSDAQPPEDDPENVIDRAAMAQRVIQLLTGISRRIIPARPLEERLSIPIPEEAKDIPAVPIRAECGICRENLINTITVPCRHAVMCVSCAREHGSKEDSKCPVCRTVLHSIEMMYLSYTLIDEPVQPRKKQKTNPA